MSRKQWVPVALAVLLGSVSLYINLGRFGKGKIQVHHRSRPARAEDGRSAIEPLFFAFDSPLTLTSLKVVLAREMETTKYPHPIWHLVSDSNSIPTADFTYGSAIGGMRPAVAGATPEPLVPGVKYRLLIQAGALQMEHDFVPKARSR